MLANSILVAEGRLAILGLNAVTMIGGKNIRGTMIGGIGRDVLALIDNDYILGRVILFNW